jgi:excisionase family DNA binding protein
MLLTVQAVAEFLSCSAKYVRSLIKSGALHAVRIGPHWRVDEVDLALFVKRRRV